MKKQYKLTDKGVVELEQELVTLKSRRSEVAERIKTAREFGDLSENAEYSSARQEQEKNESRIAEIERILENVEIISQPKNKTSVELGNTVELKNKDGNKSFTIVGSVEADPLSGKISDESPIGQALLGKKLGDEVEIKLPSTSATYKIAAIS